MPRFYFQEQALLAAAPGDCVEAARRTLAEMGGKPVITGGRVTALLGSQLKMRLAGGAFCPARWLPIDVVVEVLDIGGQRQVVVSVAERLGLGAMIGMERKYRTHCHRTAVHVRDTIGQRLAIGR